MALTVQSITPTTWDPSLDFATDVEIVKRALDGDQRAARQLGRNGADFTIQSRTDTSATEAHFDLSAAGVTFPAGFLRTLEVESYLSGDNANEAGGYLKFLGFITGGTTPVARVSILSASTPVQVPTNFVSAVAAGGFAGPSTSFVVTANAVTLVVITGEAEILNWTHRIKIGKLVPFIAGV